MLKKLGYGVLTSLVDAADPNPQQRRRHVLWPSSVAFQDLYGNPGLLLAAASILSELPQHATASAVSLTNSRVSASTKKLSTSSITTSSIYLTTFGPASRVATATNHVGRHVRTFLPRRSPAFACMGQGRSASAGAPHLDTPRGCPAPGRPILSIVASGRGCATEHGYNAVVPASWQRPVRIGRPT